MASHDFEYLIALGSNSGDRLHMLNQSVHLMQLRIGPVTAFSRIFETEPLGPADKLFLNAAVKVSSNLNPDLVMQTLLQIEQNLGRVRTEKWGNRTIDLDILLVRTRNLRGQLVPAVVDSPTLTIPHPEMLRRGFVIVPAAEIAGNWVHPASSRTLEDEATDQFTGLTPAIGAYWQVKSGEHITPLPAGDGPTPTFI